MSTGDSEDKSEKSGVRRRALLRGSVLAAGGFAGGAVAASGAWYLRHRTLPITGGYADAANALPAGIHGRTSIVWYVHTERKVAALTFDDGPAPKWTPQVLDALDRQRAPATFFMVGARVMNYGSVLRNRMARHELGNHTWSHPDLAKLDFDGVKRELERTHRAIEKVFGRAPRLFRPPYGHVGGSTVLAADTFGYDVVLWSQKMQEMRYRRSPTAQVRDIVDGARPGGIVLAHDVGKENRLVALNRLDDMIKGLRGRGFELLTVSQMLGK